MDSRAQRNTDGSTSAGVDGTIWPSLPIAALLQLAGLSFATRSSSIRFAADRLASKEKRDKAGSTPPEVELEDVPSRTQGRGCQDIVYARSSMRVISRLRRVPASAGVPCPRRDHGRGAHGGSKPAGTGVPRGRGRGEKGAPRPWSRLGQGTPAEAGTRRRRLITRIDDRA